MKSSTLRSWSFAVATAGMLGALVSGGAQAADNVNVTVNATIVGVCKFFTAAPVINITNTGTGSNIDPSSGTTATGNVLLDYRCSNGTAPGFTVPATATVTCGSCVAGTTMVPTIASSGA